MHVLCAYVYVFVNVCVYSSAACVMPVTGDITLSPRLLPAAEAVPEGGGRQLDGEDGRNTLQSYSQAKPLRALSPHFSLRLNYQLCRWEDMQ